MTVDFYETQAKSSRLSPFLSPYQTRSYVCELALWVTSCGSGTTLEIGPGYGELVRELVARETETDLFLVDKCRPFLELAGREWRLEPSRFHALELDVAEGVRGLPPELRARMDRVVAINVVQDVILSEAVSFVAGCLSQSGEARLTILSKETMDAFYRRSRNYDSAAGVYLQNYIDAAGRAQTRWLRFSTMNQIMEAFELAGLRAFRVRNVTYAASDMLRRWESRGSLGEVERDAVDAMVQRGYYVDGREFWLRAA